jgi:hypothetical protein
MPEEYIQELKNGLILRTGRPEDAERLGAFNAQIHGRDNVSDYRGVEAWTKDLATGNHPTFRPGDFLFVEEKDKGRIVSSLNLISQTWTYAGIPIKVGRVELVGTTPEFRQQGLIRAQFEVVHQWSRERGELLQAITGIPYYYRQFGYEMALALSGGRIGYSENIPELPANEKEPFLIRPAEEKDLVFMHRLDELDSQTSLIYCQQDLTSWRYLLNGMNEANINRKELKIITNPAGNAVGFIIHPPSLYETKMALEGYHLLPEVSWWEVTPSVMRYLLQTGQAYGARDNKTCSGIYFCLGEDHPSYPFFPHRLPKAVQPYAYYLRVPDLGEFLLKIRPVLEKRLAEGIRPDYSGTLEISFFRSGIRLVFEHGKLVTTKTLATSELANAVAGFPYLSFLQIVFGYRSLEDLRRAFPDFWVNDDKGRPLLSTLFPKKVSRIWPIS